MPQTPNHGYNVPNEGESDWHEPLNENFEQYDTDIEVRDEAANIDDYTPKAGAKFVATDTEEVFVGDGSSWNRLDSTGLSPSFDSIDSTGPFLGVGRSSRLTTQERFGVATGATGTSYGGMYLSTESPDARPFYGYDTAGSRMWHYYDGGSGSWHLNNGGDRLTVQDDGNVGIGTRSPGARLDVDGTATSTRLETDHLDVSGPVNVEYPGAVEVGHSSEIIFQGSDHEYAFENRHISGNLDHFYLQCTTTGNELSFNPDGDLRVDGSISASSKNFVQPVDTDDGEKEVVYTACEAPTPRTEASGVGTLDNGRAEVNLPEHFAWVTDGDEPLVVQTTPYGGSRGVKVVERSPEHIVVEDLDGEGDYEFAYTVKGTRDGYADQEVVREPTPDRTGDRSPTPADD